MPATAFVIPTRNRLDKLRRCLDSALAQTTPVNIVVVDAGSDDGTGEYLRQVSFCNSRIHVETLRRDPGMIETWRIGACVADTEWIRFALDDDWVDAEWTHRCQLMLADDVAAVLTNALVHFPDGRAGKNLSDVETGHYPNSFWRDVILHLDLTISPSCALIRRDNALDYLVCGRIPHTQKRSKLQDCYMMIGALATHPRVAWINEPLAHFDASPGCITSDAMAQIESANALRDGYAEIKAAWVRNVGGYR